MQTREVGGDCAAAGIPVPAAWLTPDLFEALRAVSSRALEESVLPREWTLRALRHFRPEETRVVILGQDPYPTSGKANGLAFGLNPEWVQRTGYRPHSSFAAILGEVHRTEGPGELDWSLESWAKQGVLLLNTRLSVAPGRPMSHAGMGWEAAVAAILVQVPANAVWLAWGAEATRVARRYAATGHLHHASHPCKYSATRGRYPFVGCGHFAAARGYAGIQWLVREGGE